MTKKKDAGPIAWSPPSPKERIRMAAEDFARVVAEANPQTLRLKDRVLKDALRAAKAPGKKG
jgi:hypothetical protein